MNGLRPSSGRRSGPPGRGLRLGGFGRHCDMVPFCELSLRANDLNEANHFEWRSRASLDLRSDTRPEMMGEFPRKQCRQCRLILNVLSHQYVGHS